MTGAERERTIERYLGNKVKALGCLYMKFVSPGNVGVPDRIIVTPAGDVIFVELKTISGVLSEAQRLMLKRLEDHKADVWLVHGMAGADVLIQYIQHRLKRGIDDGI